MELSNIVITGDTPGLSWSVPVLNFKGSDPAAAKTYMQGALHADELPGPAVLHFLCQHLRQAEAESRLLGDVTIVPQANPIGLAQMANMQLQGRFDVFDGTNFNRDFQLIAVQDRETLLSDLDNQTPTSQLKNHLLYMALGAEIVVDLHCDYEALLYTYVCEEFWPDAKDFAKAMGLHTVFVADGQSTAFEEAVAHGFCNDDNPNPPRRFVTTLELRGQRDVSESLARQDAAGLLSFLTGRGIIQADIADKPDWNGNVIPLDNIEVIRAPVAGTVLLEKSIGEVVKKGDLLAKIISDPGVKSDVHLVSAPQDGIIISRMIPRFAPRGVQLYKIIGEKPSATRRQPGALEA